MIEGYKSITEAWKTKAIPRGPIWIGAAVRLGHIKGVVQVGATKLIPNSECKRIAKNPPIISRKDLGRD